MNKYELLLHDPQVYSQTVIVPIISKCDGWLTVGCREREQYIRKIYCASLLVNRTPGQRADGGVAQAEGVAGSSSSGSSEDTNLDKFRYYCVSGIQSLYMYRGRWGLEDEEPFDIYDTVERKKIYLNLGPPSEYPGWEGVPRVLVDPVSCTVSPVDCEISPSGLSKCVNFLSQRKMRMIEIGLPASRADYEIDLAKLYEVPAIIQQKVESWVGRFKDLQSIGPPDNINMEISDQLNHVNLQDLADRIDDPRNRPGFPYVTYRGKIFPPMLTDNLVSPETTDFELVRSWISLDSYEEAEGDLSCLTEIQTLMERDEANAFNLSPMSKISDRLKDKLGVGRKTRIRDDENDSTKQPEKQSSTNRQYHPWFDTLMRDLSCLNDREIPTHHWYDDPLPHEHPMAVLCHTANTAINELLVRTNAYSLASAARGFYSRIGGAFRSISNLGIFPITYLDENEQHIVSGICLLPPPHPAKPGDKISFMTFERIRDTPRALTLAKFMCPGKIFKTSSFKYVVRINSCMKEDAGYLTFINSSSFLVSNMVGELFIQNPNNTDTAAVRAQMMRFINESPAWISCRFTESVAQALLARSEEEGCHAICRKLFLVMKGLDEGKICLTFDIQELTDKLSECLKYSPLAMYWACQFIDSLRALHRKWMSVPSIYRDCNAAYDRA